MAKVSLHKLLINMVDLFKSFFRSKGARCGDDSVKEEQTKNRQW